MRCAACGTEHSGEAKFCQNCGARLARSCPACGHEVAVEAKFCPECGRALGQALAPKTGSAPPSEYTPRHLAERILAARDGLTGERKQVTVLFADLKGSTELIQGLDPEEADALVRPAVQAMVDAVHRYEGTVNRVQGDGVMALFGAPLAHEDHAVRACYAALALQEAVGRHAGRVRRKHGVSLQARVGLNSGEVVIREIGSDLHVEYDAVGLTTNLAARMEQLAAPGTIQLAPATQALAEGYVEARSLGPVPVSGLSGPIEVFELLGAGAAHTRLQALARRGLTRFVGRQAEVEALQRSLEQAGQSRGQVVALVGEPGVGKSRLVWEVTHSHWTEGWLVLECGSVSYGKATSYLPVIDLLKSYCRIEARDDARTIREKLTGKLLALDQSLGTALPVFLSLLDVDTEDPAWQALDPPQRRQRTLDALKRLLLRESREQPLLLVFEDLHWIDSETQALLDGLVEALPTARVVLLVTYRPEYTHGWGNKSYYTQLRIDPLGQQSAVALLTALLGDDPAIRPLASLLIDRTEGNPFFLEESVRTLVETGALAGERGVYRLTRSVAEVQVPATVQTVLAARIDRLLPDDKRLLQTASVIGKDVPFALLQAIVDTPDAELEAGLSRLQSAELLYAVSQFPELEYTFKHALTHEVAYGSLLQERRRALHGRIVDAIERLYGDRVDEQVERLGHHAARGQVWEKAVVYLRRAALKAASRSANHEAAAFFGQALAALEHLPDSRSVRERSIDMRLELRNVLLPLNELASMGNHLRAAEALALALNDRSRLGWVSAYLTAYYFNTSMSAEAEEAARRALAIATELDDFPLQVMAHFFLGLTYLHVCNYRASIASLSWNVDALRGDRAHDRCGEPGLPAVFSRSYLVRALADVGELAEGIARGEEALRLALAADLPFSVGSALEGLGYVHLRRGALHDAIEVLERGRRLCEEWTLHLIHYPIAAYLGNAYALAGQDAKALPLLEMAATVPDGLHPALRVTMLGEAHLVAGRLTEASQSVERALSQARLTGEIGNRAWALRLSGEIAARRERPDIDEAEQGYRGALTITEELGMRPLQAHCHLGLGKLFRRAGRGDAARTELSTAVELLRAMEMTFWLSEAEAELATIG